MSKERVLVLGLDGATFDLIIPFIEKGILPNLENLIKGGVSGDLESTIPPLTLPAWYSLATGKNPGKLGIFDLVERRNYSYSTHPYSISLKEKSLWNYLNEHGYRTGILNFPGTFPPRKVDGFVVTGMLTPSERENYTYPSSLKAILNHLVGEYKLDVDQMMYSDEDAFLKDIFDVTTKRGKTAEYLIQNFDWSFLMVVFTSIDRIQHVMWKYIDQTHPQYDSKKAKRYSEYIKYYWRKLDTIIGKLIKKVGKETTIIIVSDHGFGPRNQTFYVNEWLRGRGYLKLKKAKRKSPLTKIAEYLYDRFGNTMFYHYFIGLLQKLISRKFIYRFFYQFWSHEGMINKIDWKNTKAFSCLHTSILGNIYVNLEGREPEGTVIKENYEDVRNHIINDLKKLIDPKTGKQMNVKAYKREEIYYGPYTDQAPDIIFSINNGECESDVRFGHTTIIRQGTNDVRQSGTHRDKGVFIAHGANIKQGHKIKGAKIIDITPTLLHIFGVPIPKNIDGRVLKDIFKQESSPGKKQINFSETSSLQEKKDNDKLTKENEDLIIKRLRNLGYL